MRPALALTGGSTTAVSAVVSHAASHGGLRDSTVRECRSVVVATGISPSPPRPRRLLPRGATCTEVRPGRRLGSPPVEASTVVKLCSIEECGKAVEGRGRYCSAHYERRRLYGEPLASAPNTRPWRGQSCMVPGCDRPNRALGLCKLHVQRAYAHNGDPLGGRWTPNVPPPTAAPVDLLGAYQVPHAPDRGPIRELRAELARQRAEHVPFYAAWPIALALVGAELDPWREALEFGLAEWRAAYQGEPPALPFGVPDPWRAAEYLARGRPRRHWPGARV